MSAADEDLAPDQPTEYPRDCCKAAGDSEAEFIRQLTGAQCSLRGYILALLGGQKKEADDVLQDTNVAIWEKRAKYDDTRPFLPWAIAFAYQRIRALRRDSARSRLVFSDQLVAELHGYFEQSFVKGPNAQDHLRLCLEKLSPNEQELIQKRYYGSTSIEALSAMINKSAGSIANRIFRIREKLRSCIEARVAQAGHES